MSIIIPANSAVGGGYNVDNSCRFNKTSSDYLNKTLGTATNRKKFTFSLWCKRSSLTDNFGQLMTVGTDGGTNIDEFNFHSTEKLSFQGYESGVQEFQLRTNQLFRDISAWYHVVVAYDSTQGTSSNRIKMYINGTQVTSFAIENYPDQNHEPLFNSNVPNYIGRYISASYYYNGYISEAILVDGQALDPTSFGEFDEDSGIWKPIDVSGLTFGNNGYYLDFENSGALGADVSGNGNNFTVNNLTAIDQSTDTCTNNFATLNPLIQLTDATLSEGNLQVAYGSAGSRAVMLSNFGIPSSSGKWYMEFKISASSASPCNGSIGVINGSDNSSMGTYLNQDNSVYQGAGYQLWDGNKNINQVGATFGATIASGDIVGMAIDMDNKALYFSKNGTYQASGNPASGSSKTGAIDFSSLTDNGFWFPQIGDASGTQTMTYQCNFGSPAFAISSGNTDGNGYGNFEYAVPANYYSLNTKNLSEFG